MEKNLIPKLTSSLPDVEALRLYLTLPECPLMSDANNFTTLAIPFGTAILNLEKAPLKVLGKKMNSLLLKLRISRKKKPYRNSIREDMVSATPAVYLQLCRIPQ